jgi:hypothetical protein
MRHMVRTQRLWKAFMRANNSSRRLQHSLPYRRTLRTRVSYTFPLARGDMSFRLNKLVPSAPKIAVADLMRLSTSASEVRVVLIIDPRYLNSRVNSINPSPSTIKRPVSSSP